MIPLSYFNITIITYANNALVEISSAASCSLSASNPENLSSDLMYAIKVTVRLTP